MRVYARSMLMWPRRCCCCAHTLSQMCGGGGGGAQRTHIHKKRHIHTHTIWRTRRENPNRSEFSALELVACACDILLNVLCECVLFSSWSLGLVVSCERMWGNTTGNIEKRWSNNHHTKKSRRTKTAICRRWTRETRQHSRAWLYLSLGCVGRSFFTRRLFYACHASEMMCVAYILFLCRQIIILRRCITGIYEMRMSIITPSRFFSAIIIICSAAAEQSIVLAVYIWTRRFRIWCVEHASY